MTGIEYGARIKELRERKNLTRDQLAAQSGLSAKFIYEVENGKKGMSVDSLIRIADVLSCSCDTILMSKEAGERPSNKILRILSELEKADVQYEVQVRTLMKSDEAQIKG